MYAQIIRFCGIGGLATLMHVLAALMAQALLPIAAQEANLVGFLVAVLVSYAGHAKVTFRADPRSGSQLVRFLIVSVLGLAASSFTVWIVTGLLVLSFPVAMAVVAIIVPSVSFLAMRFWVFEDSDPA